MKFGLQIHHRRSIRLKGYDYSLPGAYFVTLVTNQRECLFGGYPDDELRLNPAGIMVERWWFELERKFPNVSLGTYIIMPNHFHGIISLVGVDLRFDPNLHIDPDPLGEHTGSPLPCFDPALPQEDGHVGPPLQTIIQWFKTMTTNDYIRAAKNDRWAPFNRKLWQRNYYEHIIRNQTELEKINLYIRENSHRWSEDQENLERLE